MKIQRTLLAALLIAAVTLPAVITAKNVKMPKVYMFGFAASFNDTIVHFTEIQAVDSVWMDTKTKFLLGRENYSNMLRSHLEQQHQMPHRTCIVVFDKKLKRLEKKYLKMKKQYAAEGKKVKNHNDIRIIATSEFQFKAPDIDYNEE